jgi:uncharacterized protein YdhG (YjbR/CyaY superfamily)
MKTNSHSFFIEHISAPAKRALQNEKINSLEQLAQYSEKDLFKLHGLGKSSIPKIKAALATAGLSLKINMDKPPTVEAYFTMFSPEIQAVGNEMRRIIQEAAPGAKEVISYGMPAYKINRVFVYFALYAKHIGFYSTGEGIEAFKEQLTTYKFSKGAVQFPLDKPLPEALIREMVIYKMQRDALLTPSKSKP